MGSVSSLSSAATAVNHTRMRYVQNTWKQIQMKIDSLITAPFSVDPFAIKWAAKNYE